MITRSTGIIPKFKDGGSIPTAVFPGGGFSGKTEKLDNVVQNIAQKLSETFNKDIEIRFNANRESGGTFLKLNDNFSSVGIGAKIKQNNEIIYDVFCSAEFLNDPTMANNVGVLSGNYSFDYFDSFAEATVWFVKNVDLDKIKQCST